MSQQAKPHKRYNGRSMKDGLAQYHKRIVDAAEKFKRASELQAGVSGTSPVDKDRFPSVGKTAGSSR